MIRKDNRYVDEQHMEIKIWWYELVVKTMIDNKETLYFDDRVWAPLDKKVLIGSWSLGAFINFFGWEKNNHYRHRVAYFYGSHLKDQEKSYTIIKRYVLDHFTKKIFARLDNEHTLKESKFLDLQRIILVLRKVDF
jgi:hypothetical protein